MKIKIYIQTMKETRFIGQNKEKWLEAEQLLKKEEKDPEKLSTLFVQVVDDLSFSRTYYPYRSVRVYLNKIARNFFGIIYSNQKEKTNRFKYFWQEELPQIVIKSKKELLVSLFVFSLALTIGVFSSIQDPQFANSILGDSYVNMTIENIKSGDPMAVYKKSSELDMFLSITFNNLMVAFRTYLLGIFMSIGTLIILLYNGIMVGCFQYFFIERNLLAESALTIWLHGTLEISSIILAGGAGLVLGSGLVFPDTYSRLQAFQLSAIRSLKLMLGITPIFILAAIIESFLTRYTDAPDIVRLLLILLSASFILGYFVVYPWWKNKKGWTKPLEEARLDAGEDEPVQYESLKNNADIIRDSFTLYKKYFKNLGGVIFIIGFVVALAKMYFADSLMEVRYFTETWVYFGNELFSFLKTNTIELLIINSFAVSIITYQTFKWIKEDFTTVKQSKFNFIDFLLILLVSSFSFLLLFVLEGWGSLLFFISFVFFFMLMYAVVINKGNLSQSIQTAFTLLREATGQYMGLQVILFLLATSFFLILMAPVVFIFTEFLTFNVSENDVWINQVVDFIEYYLKTLIFLLVLPIVLIASSLFYHTGLEVSGAEKLGEEIKKFKNKYAKN